MTPWKQTKPPRRSNRVQFSVRIPPEMLDALREDAEQYGRTLNGTVTFALRRYLEEVGA